ncbi:zinc ABC transporter substrate-binding protein [Roseovarius aquimarinus]|uniref:High-affinity zinc uptake system protein ZnuA n=2 Tax=Roseovarius aquimarinus TaxID=1229156 RepID=A0ABW7I3W4_9RHOB
MLRTCLVGTFAFSASVQAGHSEVPRVATDIAPVTGLVARVMEGVPGAEPVGQVVRAGASPHGYAMRPSEAAFLEQADAVFWIGETLTPWLDGSIETLAPDARVVGLLDADVTEVMEFREGARFDHDGHGHGDEGHGHDHDEHAKDEHDHDHDEHAKDEHDHGHDEHAKDEHDHGDEEHAKDEHDHGHDEQAKEEGHGHEGHDHDHSGVDPHAWLDPDNGRAWLDVIAAELSRLDPANAEIYEANAAAGKEEITAAEADVRAMLEPRSGARFVVFHDAYHYFEHHFGFPAAGAIADGDAADPGPARLEEIRNLIADIGATCALAEPSHNPGFVETVTDGTGARIGMVDPLGFEIEMGPGYYPALLRDMAERLAECTS